MKHLYSWLGGALLLSLPLAAQAQNVGIGTTQPTQKLDVDGNMRLRGLPGASLLQTDAEGNVVSGAASLSGPLNPTPVAAAVTGLSNPLVAVSGTQAVVLNRLAGTLSLYDVSNPAAPTLRGSASGMSSGVEVAMSGNTAAVLVHSGSGYIQLFTLGSGTPTVVGTLVPPAALSAVNGGIAMAGTRLYAAYDRAGAYGAFYVYDVSTPAAPTLLNAAPTTSTGPTNTTGFFTPQAVAVAGNFAAVGHIYGGAAVIDVSSPAATTVTGSVGSTSTGTYTGNDQPVALTTTTLCMLTIGTNTLSTYSLSAAGVPTLRHTYTTAAKPVSVALSGNLAYVACQTDNVLQVIDVSGGSAVLRGSASLDAGTNNLALTSTLGLVANGNPSQNMQVFSLSSARTVTVAPDGSLSTAPLTSTADFVQNQPLSTQTGSFNLSGNGALGGSLGLGTTAPVARLDVRNTAGAGLPTSGGSSQSAGHYARFLGTSNSALDLGSNGTSGHWLQTGNASSLSVRYPLLLNPNGGNVGVGTTSSPSSTLQVNGSVAVKVTNNLAGNNNGTALGDNGYVGLNPVSGADYYLLPSASSCPGRIYYIRNNSSTNIAYIGSNGGSVYEGGSINAYGGAYPLATSGATKTVTIISDGSNWTLIKSGN